MPEAHTPCANCGATPAMHADDEIETCPSYMPMAPEAPAEPPALIPRAEAEAILAAAGVEMRGHISRLEDSVNQVAADLEITRAALAEAEATNELWGAFDYELLLKAERAGIDAEGLSPIQLVEALISSAISMTMNTLKGAR